MGLQVGRGPGSANSRGKGLWDIAQRGKQQSQGELCLQKMWLARGPRKYMADENPRRIDPRPRQDELESPDPLLLWMHSVSSA